jgi:integrase
MAASDYMLWDEMKELVEKMNQELKKKMTAPGYYFKLSDGRMSLMIHLGCYTALRISDLCRLKWSDLRKDGKIVDKIMLKEKKTGKIRRIALHDDIRAHLSWHSKTFPTRGYIFQNKDGNPVSTRYVNYELGRIKEKYNLSLENMSSHVFRKTWARHLWEKSGRNSGTLEMISIALNHSSISNTRIYLGITSGEISDLYLSA